MAKRRPYFVYMMTNASGTVLYTGVTNDLRRRCWEHRQGRGSAFARRYRTHRLIYFEIFRTAQEAIAREKKLKGWKRLRKEELIRLSNPVLRDLTPEIDRLMSEMDSGAHVIART